MRHKNRTKDKYNNKPLLVPFGGTFNSTFYTYRTADLQYIDLILHRRWPLQNSSAARSKKRKNLTIGRMALGTTALVWIFSEEKAWKSPIEKEWRSKAQQMQQNTNVIKNTRQS
jgi:hypothetical protein